VGIRRQLWHGAGRADSSRSRGQFADRGAGSLTARPRRADAGPMRDVRTAVGPIRQVAIPAVVAVALVLVLTSCGAPASGEHGGQGAGARYAMTAGGARALPPAAPLRFEGPIAAGDEQVVTQVIAQARPAARRIVDAVAGLTTVSLGRPGAGLAGQTTASDSGYRVVLDLGGVYRRLGMRGVRRLVLHELAHVVDDALVPDALKAQLDAATPAGFGCDDGKSGGCAAREERFAESFAKWATGDIGNDLYLGYRVPPPTSLSGWGAPLAALVR
jgi:hypothetical protein